MGSAALVAGRNTLRSDRRRLPDAEHRVDQRGTCAREPARARTYLSVEGIRRVTLAQARAADSTLRIFPPESEAAQDVRRFPRQDNTTARWIECFPQPTRQASRRTAEPERRGPGDGGLDSSLRGESSGLRRGRLHAPHPRSARDSAGRRRTTKIFGSCSQRALAPVAAGATRAKRSRRGLNPAFAEPPILPPP